MSDEIFTAIGDTVAAFSRYEIEVRPTDGRVENPFIDRRLEATVRTPDGGHHEIEGFCDSEDGSLYRLRYMPAEEGEHVVSVRLVRANPAASHTGVAKEQHCEMRFAATGSDHPGVLRVDDEHPYHFRYSRSGRRYFWNGTTAYYLMGWQDDGRIGSILERLASRKINRVRVLLYGREYDRPWGQPVEQSDAFQLLLDPWPARFPLDVTAPEFDLRRFNVHYWRRFERMLASADALGIQVSVCFFIGGQPLAVPYPMWTEDEYRYYRYACARLSAFANVTWDLGNEHDFHRGNEFWVHTMADEVSRRDPYGHLLGAHNKAYYGGAAGGNLTMQLHQAWDAGLSDLLGECRRKQEASGRIIPQVIEEFGYEDLWERFPGHRSAETRRRVCWEVAMAGGYQTNGERAAGGGGWISGAGDDSTAMLQQVAHMVDFFTSFEWWRTSPDPDALLAYEPGRPEEVPYYYGDGRRADDRPAQGLSDRRSLYVAYLPYGGCVRLRLAGASHYTVTRFNPRSGERETLPDAAGEWLSPRSEGPHDTVYLLQA